jgi:hypothetical protein
MNEATEETRGEMSEEMVNKPAEELEGKDLVNLEEQAVSKEVVETTEIKTAAEEPLNVEAATETKVEVSEVVEIAEPVETTPETPKKAETTTIVDDLDEDESDSSSEEDDDDDDDTDSMISDSDDDHHHDYSAMSKEELLQAAKDANNHTPREAIKRIQEIRVHFFDLLRQEKKDLLQAHIDADGDPDTFEHDNTEERKAINLVFHQAQEARKEERERIEKEKLSNLALKKALLEQLRVITESDETGKSLDDVKQIQQDWKKIRVVPRANIQELWDSYTFYLDKFYDNHSINIELKDLDRRKNLETKIELCKKVDELKAEDSLKKSFILLNKYQDEFRNTGPVPREFNQEIWDRFKSACDEVYEGKKGLFEAIEAEKKVHLEAKQLLVEKAAMISATPCKKTKEWQQKTTELEALMQEWKKIGPVPKAQNQSIWKEFRGEFNTFYKNKSDYFQQLHKERKANLIIKEDLCKRAEELKESEDLNTATKEVLKLQDEWKNTGPVPDKVSNAIWKRFRSACDDFFNKKKANYKERSDEEKTNLKAKEALITRLKTMLDSENTKDSVIEELKAVQKEWMGIGYVPRKNFKQIDDAFREAGNAIYNKFKIDRSSARQEQVVEHYKNMSEMPNGSDRLKDEEFKVRKKLKFVEEEIRTWENNIQFFARSKNADKLRKEIQEKIDKANGQISRMKKEIKVLRDLKGQKA